MYGLFQFLELVLFYMVLILLMHCYSLQKLIIIRCITADPIRLILLAHGVSSD